MEKPELRKFNLSESLISQIENFNKDQESSRSKMVWVLLCVITLLALSYFFRWTGGWVSLYVIFTLCIFGLWIPISILSWLLERVLFPDHPETQNLKDYRQKLAAFDLYQRKLKKDYWFSLSGHQFEAEIAKILRPFFKNVILTKGSGDGGVDIIIEDHGEMRTIIQCKAHKKPVGPEPVRALTGVMKRFGATRAVFICLGGFTKGARDVAQYGNIFMMDIYDVIKMHESANSGEINYRPLMTSD